MGLLECNSRRCRHLLILTALRTLKSGLLIFLGKDRAIGGGHDMQAAGGEVDERRSWTGNSAR